MSLFSFFWDSNEHWLLHTRDLSVMIILIISEVFLYFLSQSVDFDDQMLLMHMLFIDQSSVH